MFKRLKEDGTYETLGIYSDEGCVRITDILHEGLDYSFLKGEGDIARRYKAGSLMMLARKISYDFLKVVIDDIIEKGNIYKLPIQSGAHLKIVTKTPAEVEIATTKRGRRYREVDLFETDYRIYEMVMDYKYYGKPRRRHVQLGMNYYKRIVANANNGKHYGDTY